MIENLTPDQEAQLDVYRDKWLEIGLATSEVNVEEAMKAITLAYKTAGLVAPTKYEVYDSPFEAKNEMLLRYDIEVTSNDFIYGAQDATWLSFYDYFLEVLDIKECERLRGLMDFAKHCGWALLFDELIVLTHNPIKIKFDEDNRTHCEDGLAIEYRDGFGVAMWHGTAIPKEWIFDRSTITPEVMFKWSNIEQRQAACEIIGWATVLKHLKAETVQEDPDKEIGILLEVELPDSGKEKFLLVIDPNTKKEVGIPVPYEMQTALEANSWTYGLDKFDFKPEFRV